MFDPAAKAHITKDLEQVIATIRKYQHMSPLDEDRFNIMVTILEDGVKAIVRGFLAEEQSQKEEGSQLRVVK